MYNTLYDRIIIYYVHFYYFILPDNMYVEFDVFFNISMYRLVQCHNAGARRAM